MNICPNDIILHRMTTKIRNAPSAIAHPTDRAGNTQIKRINLSLTNGSGFSYGFRPGKSAHNALDA